MCVGRQIQINRLTVCLIVTHLGWLLFVALCFTEFSIRLPKAGSAYFYSYATIGELCGFTVGWSMILEHSIGVAIAAKAWSQYLGHISNGSLPKYNALINPFVWLNIFNQVYDMTCCMFNICHFFFKVRSHFKVIPLEMLSNTCPKYTFCYSNILSSNV